MTECERFIEEGKFSPDFFREEERCGFLVTTERKKMWAVELDLLDQFNAVCSKHGLRYWLDGGSLLGSVRHRGFIPWDDDIDVSMLRADYEKLLTLSDTFSTPYFLQIPGQDKDYFYGVTKLRNSNTSQIVEIFQHREFNHGICLDIFPVDEWDSVHGESTFNRIVELYYDQSTYMRMGNPNLNAEQLRRIATHSGRNPQEVLRELQGLVTSFQGKGNGWLCQATCGGFYGYERELRRAEDHAQFILGQFEGREYPIPSGWEWTLHRKYGDFMAFPPVSQRGNWHHGVTINPDVPYTTMLRERRKLGTESQMVSGNSIHWKTQNNGSESY